MSIENRSSNTEMVIVPRGLIEQLEQFGEGSTPGRTVRKDALEKLYASCTEPAPQPHPDPIAWMVGTAFWWTKEEAERDAAETGLPIVGLGPMTGPGEVERKSVKRYDRDEVFGHSDVEITVPGLLHHDHGPNLAEALARLAYRVAQFHKLDAPSLADPGEVERLRAVIDLQKSLIASLRAELVESYSINASAEPSAPAVSNLPELTDDLREILGRPNFTCHFIAKALRIMGHSIAPKSEDEQAVVIHWLLGHYLKVGSDWRLRAEAELKAASVKLAPSADPQQ